jgi:hypothetical protein
MLLIHTLLLPNASTACIWALATVPSAGAPSIFRLILSQFINQFCVQSFHDTYILKPDQNPVDEGKEFTQNLQWHKTIESD